MNTGGSKEGREVSISITIPSLFRNPRSSSSSSSSARFYDFAAERRRSRLRILAGFVNRLVLNSGNWKVCLDVGEDGVLGMLESLCC